jgi:RNA polymerase sporulation-specific sigma factor
VGEDGGSLEQFLPGDSIEEKLLESMDLRNAIAALAPRQRAVIHMRYDRGMTQEQTAAVLGISQVQVSRIERKALGLLRQALSEEPLL